MQAVCSTSATAFKATSLARRAPRTGVTAARPSLPARVACKAEANLAKKAAAAGAALPAVLATHPALALVDSRLNGDGTGKALGIATGVEGFVILGVFTLVWVLYYIATKDMGEGRGSGEDSGLSL